MIVHAGARLKRDLPQALDPDLRGEIGIAAAEAAMAAESKRLDAITDLARALRFAGYPRDACDLLQRKFPDIRKTVDKAQNIRGYYYEWGTCDVTPKDAELSLSGVGVAFEHLTDRKPDGVYAKGRRAIIQLGWLANPNPKGAGYFARHQREVDALGTPTPADDDEAIQWLTEAAFAAWQELDDAFLRSLKHDGLLSFQRLRSTLCLSRRAAR
jgi:hypothetical protein